MLVCVCRTEGQFVFMYAAFSVHYQACSPQGDVAESAIAFFKGPDSTRTG